MLVPSEDSLASAIADIWSELLEVRDVGPETDFFELGGNSLAAVRMLAALEERMSVQMDFVDFLEGPTVGALASAVARALPNLPDAPVAPAPTPTAPARNGGARDGRADGGADGDARLSFAQERLWFLEQMGGSSAAYNMPIGARLHGDVDVDAMRRALGVVIDRHEALRTTFVTRDGRAVAVCAADGAVELEQLDVRGEQDPDGEAQRIVAELASRPFDLEHGPLMRAVLLRVADEEHVLELVFHHIVCDGWSQTVVMRELGALYEAYRRGEQIELDEPTDSVPGFARSQRAALEAQGLDAVTAPWLERLAGAPEALELPTDRPRPATPSYAGATYRVPLAPATTAAVRQFARERQGDAVRDAAGGLLRAAVPPRRPGRHRDRGDHVPAATGRSWRTASGLFANTVALRGDLSGEPSFGELVDRVRETVLWAMAHEQAPLQEIVARLPLERDLSRHPLFQVFCAHVPLANAPDRGRRAVRRASHDVALRPDAVRRGGAGGRAGTGVGVQRRPVRRRDDRAALAPVRCDCWRARSRIPTRSIDELELLDGEEREQAARGRARERARVPGARACTSAFERRVAAAARLDRGALRGASLTYARAERARQPARPPADRARRRRRRRSWRCSSSPRWSCSSAILAVLKAGAAYVPLDPEYPRERLRLRARRHWRAA